MTRLLRIVELVATEEVVSIISEQGLSKCRDCIAKCTCCHVPEVFREELRDFDDLLKQKSPSLFILYEWSSISVASLTVQSIYLVYVARMEVVWN
jgi:hypothetical protein